MTRERIAAFAAGLGLGLALGYLAGGAGQGIPAPPTARRIAPRSTDAPPVTPKGRERSLLIDAQQAQIDALSTEAFGVPLVWPDPASQAESEAAVRWATETCAEGVELHSVDCSEPPCLVSMRLVNRRAGDVRAACPRWTEVLDFRGYRSAQAHCDGDDVLIAAYPVTPSSDYRDAQAPGSRGRNEETRLRVRQEELWTTPHCAR